MSIVMGVLVVGRRMSGGTLKVAEPDMQSLGCISKTYR